MITCKLAAIPQEIPALLKKWPEFETEDTLREHLAERDLLIPVWDGADVGVDYERVGLAASPTKVSSVDYVVLESDESKEIQASHEGIAEMVGELVKDYTI